MCTPAVMRSTRSGGCASHPHPAEQKELGTADSSILQNRQLSMLNQLDNNTWTPHDQWRLDGWYTVSAGCWSCVAAIRKQLSVTLRAVRLRSRADAVAPPTRPQRVQWSNSDCSARERAPRGARGFAHFQALPLRTASWFRASGRGAEAGPLCSCPSTELRCKERKQRAPPSP